MTSDISRAIERATEAHAGADPALPTSIAWAVEFALFHPDVDDDTKQGIAAEVLALPDLDEHRERVARTLAAQWFCVKWDELHPYDRDDMYGMADAAIAAYESGDQ